MMMVVVDNKILENPDFLVMADDGNGESIYIASFLISYHDGLKIKSAIQQETEEPKRHDLVGDLGRRGGNRVVMRAVIDLAEPTSGKI
jgi:hypothetical protein